MNLRILEVDLFRSECQTRLPFRFGSTVMRAAPLLVARVKLLDEAGREGLGYSSDLLVPKWFRKNHEHTAEQDAEELIRSAKLAGAEFCGASARLASPFDLWWSVYRSLVEKLGEDPDDLLVQGFGIALIERSMLDAACRLAGKSFFAALKEDLFGFRPEAVHGQLSGWNLAASLPDRPLQSIEVRHTVGLADCLRKNDIEIGRRCEDGLPQALEDDIDRYGLSLFKVKIGLGFEADRRRLLDLAGFFAARGARPRWTVDGNEQFEDLRELVELFHSLKSDPAGGRLLEGLLYIEQPLHRTATFEVERNSAMAELCEIAPVIIDEADTSILSFPRAVELGYGGISVKNCKGVFRALLNRGLCEVAQEQLFQSAEDLTNLPVLSLQQDLALIASLGLPHAERNGHHYFAGLAHLPEAEAKDALRAHPDLYEQQGELIGLRIEAGLLQVGSLDCTGFGYDLAIRVEERSSIA